MEYIIGGCTGLLKEVNTKNRSLLRLSPLEDQSLQKKVTSLCWSGGFGGYFEDEITVGYGDGYVRSYNYLTTSLKREHKLDSKCIYLTMMNIHFDLFGPEIYERNKGSPIYPSLKKPNVFDNNDRLLLAVSESGYIYILDWSNHTPHLNTVDNVNPNTNDRGYGPVDSTQLNSNTVDIGNSVKLGEVVDSVKDVVVLYKYKGPISSACVHSLMRNRLVLAGFGNPPALFDLFSGSILWVGKYPHETVLGLQSRLEITSVCYLEELGNDLICVATKDSFIYVYDLTCQKDPIFEFNICDFRPLGLSKRLLSLPHEDFNTKHRKNLAKSINDKYSQDERSILKLVTNPSFTIFHTTQPTNTTNSNTLDLGDKGNLVESSVNSVNSVDGGYSIKINDEVSLKVYNVVKKEYCNLYVSDNFGTIYKLQFLTGNHLIHWTYRKIHSHAINSSSNNLNTNSNTVNYTNSGNLVESSDKVNSVEYGINDIIKMSEAEKYKIAEHLLEARKRLCSSSSNDKRIHYRKNHFSQVVCRILNSYKCHNGSVVDLVCTGNYLVSAGLDRFSSVVSLSANKPVFRIYCNQKQTCILLKGESLYTNFEDKLEFKPIHPVNNTQLGESSELGDVVDDSDNSVDHELGDCDEDVLDSDNTASEFDDIDDDDD